MIKCASKATLLPIYYLIDNFLLFAGGAAQVDASGFYAFMSHKVGQ